MIRLFFSWVIALMIALLPVVSMSAEGFFTHLVLRDVQHLFGGRNVYVDSNGQVWVQDIDRSRSEMRAHYTITPNKLKALQQLVLASQNLNFIIPERPERPHADEGRPMLIVKFSPDKVTRVGKWDDDSHPLFDPVYQYLISLSLLPYEAQILYQGSYRNDWVPHGFEGL